MIPSIEEEIRDLHDLFGSPRDPEGRAFVPLADAYRRSGDPSRALEVLQSGLERHPDLAAAHLVSGLTCRDLADDGGAEASFRRVLELDSDNARALIGLGRVLAASGDHDEGERLIERALALDGSLGMSGAPARVPRHSENAEIVGNGVDAPSEGEEVGDVESPLEAMEWEVVDMDTLAAPAATPVAPAEELSAPEDSVVMSIAELSPDAVVDDPAGPTPDAATEIEESPASPEEAPSMQTPLPAMETFDLSSVEAGDGTVVEPGENAEWGGADLDLDWGVAEPAESSAPDPDPVEVADSAPEIEPAPLEAAPLEAAEATKPARESESEPEPESESEPESEPESESEPEPESESEEPAVDLASLAPDDWAGAADEAAAALPDGGLLMDLADLAPDIQPGSRHEDESDEEALPTRTLGELYARQGLRSEAVRVFEALVARSPADTDLRARLEELRRRGDPPASKPTAAGTRSVPAVPRDDGPPVTDFFAELLSWTSEVESPGAND